MNTDKNAPLTPKGREAMVRCVEAGLSKAAAARQFDTLLRRLSPNGSNGSAQAASMVCAIAPPGLFHCQAKQRLPRAPPSRLCAGSATQASRIAVEVGVSPATVSRILRRLGLNRLSALEPAEPVRRYEREHPGELIHIDIKKLGKFKRIGHRISGDRTGPNKSRGVGWEFVHVCIDDASRIAFSRVMKDERKASAVAFLKATVTYYASLGVTIERVMTDNGSCYRSKAFARACKKLGLKHLRTKPYTPKTNGKAERFIQTSLREWAYARAYNTSNERAAELPKWLHRYNWHRPHGGIKSQTPISRLGLTGNNLLRLHN